MKINPGLGAMGVAEGETARRGVRRGSGSLCGARR